MLDERILTPDGIDARIQAGTLLNSCGDGQLARPGRAKLDFCFSQLQN
jgi:hypothetical protein